MSLLLSAQRRRRTIPWLAVLWYLLPVAVAVTAGANPNAIAEDNTAFALDLFQQLKADKGNLFFSPYSISVALAMTYGGARGHTAAEMEKALHFTLGAQGTHPAFAALNARLAAIQQRGNVQLCIANSLWPQKEYPFLPGYVALMKKYYGVASTPVDYARAVEAARKLINGWVEDKTQRRIQNLIGPGMLDPLTRLVLVNAIYFKGNWASQFKAEHTRDTPFYAAPDKPVTVRMMVQTRQYKYAEIEDLQIVELPYAGNELVMRVLLPGANTPLSAVEDRLTPERLKQWQDRLVTKEVCVCLPKFKITWGAVALNQALQNLGMRDAFNLAADFSGMDGTHNLYLSQVLHKAFVEVNEEGTEAAAATAITMLEKSVARSIVFRADRPFLFLIREQKTGSILFMGRVAAPQ